MRYRKNQGVGLFDKEDTLQELLKNGNPLPKLKEVIDFEQFRIVLEPVFENTDCTDSTDLACVVVLDGGDSTDFLLPQDGIATKS